MNNETVSIEVRSSSQGCSGIDQNATVWADDEATLLSMSNDIDVFFGSEGDIAIRNRKNSSFCDLYDESPSWAPSGDITIYTLSEGTQVFVKWGPSISRVAAPS